MWGTGLNKWVTEATKPDFWPGSNMLGAMLMDLTEELITSTSSEDVMVPDQMHEIASCEKEIAESNESE